MRVHPKFLYLHPPKTGGWTVRGLLEAAELGELPAGVHQHSTWFDLRASYAERPFVFSTVREPCAWYRSYLHYNTKANGYPKPGLARIIGGDKLDLKKALHRLLFPGHKVTEVPILGLHYPAPINELRHYGIGLYTWMLQKMLARESRPASSGERVFGVDLVMDTDAIRTELPKVMTELGLDLGTALQNVPDANRNADLARAARDILPMEGTVAEVFDPEMTSWVYSREHRIVLLMHYTGPGVPAGNPSVENP